MKRFLDVVALGALGFVVLLPRPGVEVKPAVQRLDPETEQQIAELQAALLANPNDLEAAIEVATIYRDRYRPEWALATLGPFRQRAAADFRVHLGIAIAHAERFELRAAYEALTKGLAACERNQGPVPCGVGPEARMRLLYAGLERVFKAGFDPLEHPELVEQVMYETLRKVRNPAPPKAAPASQGK